jgi:hypothetical protein
VRTHIHSQSAILCVKQCPQRRGSFLGLGSEFNDVVRRSYLLGLSDPLSSIEGVRNLLLCLVLLLKVGRVLHLSQESSCKD